jgi:hypothetical protein
VKDLDSAAITLAKACHFLLDPTLPDSELRTAVFTRIPPNMLAQALGDVGALTRPPDDVFYKELLARYRSVRRFLPTVLKHIRFGASPCGEPNELTLYHPFERAIRPNAITSSWLAQTANGDQP